MKLIVYRLTSEYIHPSTYNGILDGLHQIGRDMEEKLGEPVFTVLMTKESEGTIEIINEEERGV